MFSVSMVYNLGSRRCGKTVWFSNTPLVVVDAYRGSAREQGPSNTCNFLTS